MTLGPLNTVQKWAFEVQSKGTYFDGGSHRHFFESSMANSKHRRFLNGVLYIKFRLTFQTDCLC